MDHEQRQNYYRTSRNSYSISQSITTTSFLSLGGNIPSTESLWSVSLEGPHAVFFMIVVLNVTGECHKCLGCVSRVK